MHNIRQFEVEAYSVESDIRRLEFIGKIMNGIACGIMNSELTLLRKLSRLLEICKRYAGGLTSLLRSLPLGRLSSLFIRFCLRIRNDVACSFLESRYCAEAGIHYLLSGNRILGRYHQLRYLVMDYNFHL